MSTESVLREWRYGQTQSERLCAAILHSEGFDSVDPQCPLGGPDGLKDVLCEKGSRRFIAACYFPTTNPTLAQIKKKLKDDSAGIQADRADSLVFFVNQSVTPAERAELAEIVEPSGLELYHLERIRAILDSPKGYGLRLEYLRIPMSPEEQLSLHSVINFKLDERMREQGRQIAAIARVLQHVRSRTDDIAGQLQSLPSSLDEDSDLELQFPTAHLSKGNLCWLHRVVTDASHLPVANRGVFRDTEVWIGTGGNRDEATFIPPPPSQIQPLLTKLLVEWRSSHPQLVGAAQEDIVEALAAFHHGFLSIHPFLDANGRVARAILQQQTVELLGRWVSAVFRDEPRSYYEALRQADAKNLQPLIRLISANLE